MKRIARVFLVISVLALFSALPASAAFSPKGRIPNGEPVRYRGLKVTAGGVYITLVNKGGSAVAFSASVAFLGEGRAEAGDFFIGETIIEPESSARLEKLFLKGDAELCRKAASLRWTIYVLEER